MIGDWTLAGIATGAIVLLDAVMILRVISRESGFERTLTWIFAILAFPLAGSLAYLALASPSIKRTTAKKRERARGVRRREHGGPTSSAGSLARLAESLTGLPTTDGNAVELLVDDDAAFARIEKAIRGARTSIWAEYYIVANDATGRRFLDLLTERASEGLEVRFLYDAVGSFNIDVERLRALSRAGGRSECFLPLNPLRRRWSVHLRNHRKLVVIDGETGFTGGMNVGDQYSGRARRKGASHFYDSHLALRGPAVGDLAQVFAEDWSFATDEPLELPPRPAPDAGDARVAVVPSGPDQAVNASGLLHFAAITEARERVWLTSPYFIPDEPMLAALTSAALRGVDVRLLLPARCDVALVRLASRSHYGRLLRCGARVFEYEPAMLHAKLLLVDDEWAIVGSANADIRSFRWNFEVGALVHDPGLADALAARYETDLRSSTEIDASEVESWSARRRLGYAASRLLSPFL